MEWSELEPKINTLMTRRILTFHDALVERGQIPPPLMPSDPEETDGEGISNRCNPDSAA